MRKFKELNIRSVLNLSQLLNTSEKELAFLAEAKRKYYRLKTIKDSKGKERKVYYTFGRFRTLQDALQKYLQRLHIIDNQHGGIKNRSTLTNAKPHIHAQCLVKLDLKNFFPSISHTRIYNFFVIEMKCSPDVARFLTELTTVDYHLPLGFPTSPILAVLVSKRLTQRLSQLAIKNNAQYTQFIDDISFSGHAKVVRLVDKIVAIVNDEGFKVNEEKTEIASEEDERIVTGIRVNNRVDIPSSNVKEIKQLIAEINADDEMIKRKIKGKIDYVMRFNRGCGKTLLKQLNSRKI